MAQLLVNSARPFIFSTAPPPPAVAGALAALELLAEEPRRVEKLQANADALRDELARERFEVSGSTTQIVPLVIGEATSAMRICELAIERGVFAQAIRPPTVPDGTSRLRLAVMASHSKDELREAAQVLGRAALQAGWRPGDGVPIVAAREEAAASADSEPARSTSSARRRSKTRCRFRDLGVRAPRSRPRGRRRHPNAACSSPAPTPASARPSSPRRSPPRCGPRASRRRRSSRR